MISDDLAAQELLHRLVRIDYAHRPTLEIIDEYRAELKQQREQHAHALAEMAANTTFKVRRLETVQSSTSPLPTTRDAEVITVQQADIDEFCRVHGTKKAELLDSIASKRGEFTGKNGTRWIAQPNHFSAESEQGNREAHEQWEQETKAEEAYFAAKKAKGAMQQPYPTNPTHSTFSRG